MPKFVVKITFDTLTGGIGVEGPKDEILLLGMIEKAKIAIATSNKEKRQIVPATIIPTLKGGKR